MKIQSRLLLCLMLTVFCLSVSGCALLKLPFEILATLIKFAQQIPKPPPGVIPGVF